MSPRPAIVLRRLPLLLTCGALLLDASRPVIGQDAVEAERLDAVFVTGSNIKRTDIETALPLQIITREDIERSGVITAAALLRHVSANLNGRTDVQYIFDPQAGLASANLRGLGDASTLVLLDGRRAANYAASGGAVNLNFIPLAAIERVEVLKDGASAIYGADAMAGVINFILRKDFRGVQATAYGAQPQHGGGSQTQLSATAGYGDPVTDRINGFVTVSYQRDSGLPARDRAFSRTAYRPDEGAPNLNRETYPANIRTGPSIWVNPSFATGCSPPVSLPIPDTGMCGHDTLSVVNLIPPSQRVNLLGGATWQLDADNRLFGQYLYAHNQYDLIRNQTPISADFSAGHVRILYPADGRYYPTEFAASRGISGDLDLYYRAVPTGPITEQTKNNAQHLVIGAEGAGNGWNYNAAWLYSKNGQEFNSISGNISTRRLIDAMATGRINPFGPSGPDGDALLANTQVTGEVFHTNATTNSIELKASRELGKLPGGPVAIALGAEARRERLEIVSPVEFNSGDVFGVPRVGSTTSGSRSVGAIFGELNINVLRTLDAQLAARYDYYGDFGSTWNPKVAVRWQPVPSWLIRSSYGTGFRPPTLTDLFTSPSLATTRLRSRTDPARCPVTRLPSDCDTFFPALFGGNQDLEPETSEQFNVGLVWAPFSSVSLGVDYWKIDKKGAIGALAEDTLFNNFGRFERTDVHRGPVDAAFPALPGPVQFVFLGTQNLGDMHTSGIDAFVAFRGRTPVGDFGFSLDGTYVAQWQQQLDGVNFVSAVGRNLIGPIPRWRHYATLSWNRGPWGATLAQTFSSGYTDANLNAARAQRQVAAYDVWDVRGTYAGLENTTLALGIKNLFDRDPPFSNQTALGQVMYDPRYADPRGRVLYAALTFAFR
jgi:iron complex outermembrane receptor protein